MSGGQSRASREAAATLRGAKQRRDTTQCIGGWCGRLGASGGYAVGAIAAQKSASLPYPLQSFASLEGRADRARSSGRVFLQLDACQDL